MAEGLILEFEGFGKETYDAVNAQLGLDTTRPSADWPQGMRFHAAGEKPGGFVVFEIWDSREDNARFFHERLGAALQAGGAGEPSRIEWIDLAAFTATGG